MFVILNKYVFLHRITVIRFTNILTATKMGTLEVSYSKHTGLLAVSRNDEGVELVKEDIQGLQQIINGEITLYSRNISINARSEGGATLIGYESQMVLLSHQDAELVIERAQGLDLASAKDFE